MSAPLDKLRFMLGEWKGRAEGQFGEKGVIESRFDVTQDPSERFITSRGESRHDGELVLKAISILLYDTNIHKYVRKSAFSYGWILNEVGDWTTPDRLVFDVVSTDGEPEAFKGTRWRSFIQKNSDNEIGTEARGRQERRSVQALWRKQSQTCQVGKAAATRRTNISPWRGFSW